MSCPSQGGPSVCTKKREERKDEPFPKRKIQPYNFWIPISFIKLWVHKTRTSLRRHINQINRKLWGLFEITLQLTGSVFPYLLLHFSPVFPDIIVLPPSHRPLWIASLLSSCWPLMWKGSVHSWCGVQPCLWCFERGSLLEQSSVACTVSFCSEVTIWADFSQYAACSISTNSPKIIKGQVNFSRHQEIHYLRILAILYKLLLPAAFWQHRVSTLLWCSSQMGPTALWVAPQILATMCYFQAILSKAVHVLLMHASGVEFGAFTEMSRVYGYVLCRSASKKKKKSTWKEAKL